MNYKHFVLVSVLTGLSAAMAPVHAQNQGAATDAASQTSNMATSSVKVARSDQNMMRKLAMSNQAEIDAGNLAMQKSSNSDVKSFAQHMVDDHTQASNDLQALAQQKNVMLPTQPDAKHMATAKKLATMSGQQFDTYYLNTSGLKDHRDTLSLLKNISTHAKDKDLKNLADKLIPTVSAHLDMAQKDMQMKRPAASSDTNKQANARMPTSALH